MSNNNTSPNAYNAAGRDNSRRISEVTDIVEYRSFRYQTIPMPQTPIECFQWPITTTFARRQHEQFEQTDRYNNQFEHQVEYRRSDQMSGNQRE